MSANIERLTDWRDYFELTKPRVVMLIVFTAVVGMFLAVPGWPDPAALPGLVTRANVRQSVGQLLAGE